MTDPSPTARPQPDPRRARLAEALRANLHRRKAQARAQADDAASGPNEADLTAEGGIKKDALEDRR